VVNKEETLAANIEQIYTDPSVKDPHRLRLPSSRNRDSIRLSSTKCPRCRRDIAGTGQRSPGGIRSDIRRPSHPHPTLSHDPLTQGIDRFPARCCPPGCQHFFAGQPLPGTNHSTRNTVSSKLDVSALVVDIGGVGIYPTMVEQSSDANWVITTIAHEWTHNFLTLRPLGLNYDTNNSLRTMNETTAEIVGTEIGQQVIDRYYPELKGASDNPSQTQYGLADASNQTSTFDFNAEMHDTRVTVDQCSRRRDHEG